MKRLIGTTAIAALMGLPLAAQQATTNQGNTGTEAAPAEAESQVTTGETGTNTRNAQAQGDVQDGATRQGDTQAAQSDQPRQQGDTEAAQSEQPQQQRDTQTAQTGQPQQQGDTQTAQSGQPQGDQMRIEVTSLIDQAVYLPSEEARQNVRRVMDEAPEGWEMVGEIRDLIVARDGTVAGVVVDAGGYLGGEGAQRIVPMNAMTFVRDGNDEGEYFVLFRGDENAFGQAPAYDSAAVRQAGGASAAEAGFLDDVQRETQPVEMVDVNVDNVLGARAYGPEGEWVGEVSELAVAEDGQIEAFIVDVGGFLGVGDKPVALEPGKVDVTRTNDDALRVSVDATEAELESMERWAGEQS